MRTFSKSTLFQKAHRGLTFLFTSISGLILIILSVCYLYMSEKEWKDYSYLSFLRESETIVSNLAQQKTISYRYLAEITARNHYMLAVYDNGTPLNFTSLLLNEQQKDMADTFLAFAAEHFANQTDSSDYATLHTDFSYKTLDGICYNVYAAKMGNKSSPLYAVIFSSAQELDERLHGQRIRFLLIDCFGILFLFLFSYFYTKKLLSPIRQNQQQQNAFLAAASHELRTPLAAILSSVSACRMAKPDMQKQFLDIIDHESSRMSSLVNDMLTLSRADNHTWSFSMKKAELDTLLLNIYETFLPLAKAKNCSLSVKLPKETLPPCVCDEKRIEQVLFILLNNAVSHGISDKASHVQMELIFSGNEFELRIIDHGSGISADAKKHIFDRFYRGDASRSIRNTLVSACASPKKS